MCQLENSHKQDILDPHIQRAEEIQLNQATKTKGDQCKMMESTQEKQLIWIGRMKESILDR